MAEVCYLCLTQLKLWDDYVAAEDNPEECMLCSKCQKIFDDLYDKHEGRKSYEKCADEIRKSLFSEIWDVSDKKVPQNKKRKKK